MRCLSLYCWRCVRGWFASCARDPLVVCDVITHVQVILCTRRLERVAHKSKSESSVVWLESSGRGEVEKKEALGG